MLGASFLLAFREISRHVLRSILTVVGIVIGVSAVITMVTVGNGVTSSVRSQIAALGANTLLIVPNASGREAGSNAPRPFKLGDVQSIRGQIGGVEAVAGQANSAQNATVDGITWQTTVTGTSEEGLAIQAMTVTAGRVFTAYEDAGGKNVCIVGDTVRRALFPDTNPVGREMRVGRIACAVIGLLKKRGQGGMGNDQDDVVLMPLHTVQRQLLGTDDIYWIAVRLDPAYDNVAVSTDLDRLLRERRHLPFGQSDDFRIIDMKQISDTVSETLKVLTGLVATIASISLVVGGIGIVNIMLVSVTERTREIGIRLAIGALAREVRLQFLTEAVVLCALGGAIGITLAFGLSILLSLALSTDFVFDPLINIGSFVFSSMLGVVFGYVPAQRAAALNPIEALRHE